MFILKKVVTFFVLPPGIFIVLLALTAIFVKKWLRMTVIVLAALLYLCSIEPAKNLLLLPLENAYNMPSISQIKQCDAYVVLGGGINENTPDIDGKDTLSNDALARVIGAYRLYQKFRKPIILSGGKAFTKRSEAVIAKAMLLSLGVREHDIILEERSVDTYENARYVKEIAEKRSSIRKILLITNAFHMKRSMLLFDKRFKETVPFPAGYMTSRSEYDWLSYFPSASNLEGVSIALKEYFGIFVYKFVI